MVNETTFNRAEIERFLSNTGNTFLSSCWYVDKMLHREETEITHTETSTWFRRHLADSNRAQYLFRLAEQECTQKMLIA